MKTLIQIQAVINLIEDLTLTSKKYHSTFKYQREDLMTIETYAVEHTLNLMATFKHGNGYSLYLKDNNTIEVLELPFDDVDKTESED